MSKKIGMVTIAGRLEAGEVVVENTYTARLKFEKLPGQPAITLRKNKIRLILADRWETEKEVR